MIFDWNDQELANIIWGDTGENDDHTVPYRDGSENKDHNKEWEKEGALAEQKKSAAGHGSQPDFSPSNSPKFDINAMCNERFTKTTEISNNELSRSDEKPQSGDGFEIYKQPEGKEERDLVNCDWVNVDSFDDLDRIFSNDQMSGNASVGNEDELWSSSKNVTTSLEMSVSLSFDSQSPGFEALGGSKPEHFETKVEHLLDPHWPAPGFQKMNNHSCHSMLGAKDSMINFETIVVKSQPTVKSKAASEMVGITSGLNHLIDSGTVKIPSDSSDEVNRKRNLLKSQKILPLKDEAPKLQKFFGSCSSDGRQSQYPSMPALPLFQSCETNQRVPYGYEISTSNSNSLNNQLNSAWKILSMTPTEKIAKLRNRQKMRAMAAIQKQQQKFSHQASSSDTCISPMEQHTNSNIVQINIDKYSIEDSVLNQLQDVVNKLGIQTRLCIRDSLFRLAQSSIQRQHGIGTSITSISSMDVLAKGGANTHKQGSVSMSEVETETETNPIDRTVAHLLFHRRHLERDPFVHIPCFFTQGEESENASNFETVEANEVEISSY